MAFENARRKLEEENTRGPEGKKTCVVFSPGGIGASPGGGVRFARHGVKQPSKGGDKKDREGKYRGRKSSCVKRLSTPRT